MLLSQSSISSSKQNEFTRFLHCFNMKYIVQLEAGQYCTFVVAADGSVRSCGKGSYGRLGLGDSNNQTSLKRLPFDAAQLIRRLSSSKGIPELNF